MQVGESSPNGPSFKPPLAQRCSIVVRWLRALSRRLSGLGTSESLPGWTSVVVRLNYSIASAGICSASQPTRKAGLGLARRLRLGRGRHAEPPDSLATRSGLCLLPVHRPAPVCTNSTDSCGARWSGPQAGCATTPRRVLAEDGACAQPQRAVGAAMCGGAAWRAGIQGQVRQCGRRPCLEAKGLRTVIGGDFERTKFPRTS